MNHLVRAYTTLVLRALQYIWWLLITHTGQLFGPMSSIPELKQKKIARDAAIAEAAAASAKKAEKDAAEQEKLFYANAEKYEAEYAELSKQAIANRRDAKANNQIYVAPEEKLVFVIRLRGIIGVSPKVTF